MPNIYSQTQEKIEPLDLRFSEEELDERHSKVLDFIKQQTEKFGAEGALVAVSGGVDSSTTVALAAQALGTENVKALLLPREQIERVGQNMSGAEEVVSELGVEYETIEIDPISDQVFESWEGAQKGSDAAGKWESRYEGNVSARCRMIINYLVAQVENRIVLGTGNRAELQTGYITKYGDGGIDCEPLGNLYKQQVRQMAAHVGLPEKIVQRTPDGGLVDYDTDEEEMGADFDTVDAVIALHIDGNVPATATAEIANTTREVVDNITEMYHSSEHKRNMPATPKLQP